MTERITLLLSNREDRRLLGELLESDYRVLAPEPGSEEMNASLEEAFDLLVADGASLKRFFDRIRLRKEAEKEVYLPVLLVTGSEEVARLGGSWWEVIDEVVRIPADKKEISLRVASLLRARTYSKEAVQRYYTLAESGGVGVAIVQDEEILWINSALAEMFGIAPGKLLGTSFFRAFHPEDAEAVREQLRNRTDAREAPEVRLDSELGPRWAKLHIAPVLYKGRDCVLVMATDTTELRSAFEDTVYRLALAAEYKDDFTGSHILRIGHYSAFLAGEYGLSSKDETVLRTAAPMHDVGKIGIPDHILQKPARLTDEEFGVIKTHTTIGANLMQGSDSDVLEAARVVALSHHEKYDGSGYPRGLQGEAIPVYGRIVALCDVWDALISERPYKPAYDLDTSREIIRSERGRHFDPDLVDIFLTNLDNLLQMRDEVNSRGTDFSELLTSRQASTAK